MFKPQILRRNFSLFNRIPHSRIVRSAARDGHETITIQRFRLHKPFFSRSRLVGALAVGAAFYITSRYISVEITEEVVEDDKQQSKRLGSPISDEDEAEESSEEVEEDDEEEEEYDDALIFLPTGFSRPKPRTFYRGSDPEWQEFRKLATDRPRMEKIRNELSSMLRTSAKKNPSYAARLGNIDTTKGNAWVEVRFPDGPPIEFERPGIELTEDLEWRKTTRPVEELHHKRLTKLLYPSEVTKALYQDTKRKLDTNWKSFRAYVGWEAKAEPETVRDVIQRVVTTPPSASGPAPPSASSPPSAQAAAATDTKQPTDPASPLDNATKHVWFALPDPKKFTSDMSQFSTDFRKTTKPYTIQAPRGTFVVLGLIEVHGDRAKMTLNVTAAYDPKQGKYVGLSAALWNLKDHRQRPRGGP